MVLKDLKIVGSKILNTMAGSLRRCIPRTTKNFHDKGCSVAYRTNFVPRRIKGNSILKSKLKSV